ncbi:glycosyltransferase family 4 protein [Methylomicrobium lacus]|uniref:glycosyltransferase family 4 protein n=1 Tax=Methylomicrobium lacus TaxID=136992 RepID=UPI0035A905B9
MSAIKTRNIRRIVIVTNIPTPYRIPIYQKLATKFGYDHFHVIFCSEKEDNREWVVEQDHFAYTFLKRNYISWKGRYIHYNLDVLKVLCQLDPDVVITTGFNPTQLLAFGYTVFYKKVHLPTTDGTYESEQILSGLHRLVRRIVYGYSNAFLGASLGSLRLYKSYGISQERFFQSHLCADNAAFTPFLGGNRDFDLMFSGRFAPEKNPLFALDVAVGVAKVLNRKISILMLGSGQLFEQVRDYADTLRPHVTASFPGFMQQAELPKQYSSAKLFLFPSSWDPWGVVANEACAAGQAIIVSPHAGVANELVCDGQNGYVLELDLALWVNHTADLLSNKALLERFSKESAMKVQAYNYDAAAQGIVDAVLASQDPS